jgi:hypothetical protein
MFNALIFGNKYESNHQNNIYLVLIAKNSIFLQGVEEKDSISNVSMSLFLNIWCYPPPALESQRMVTKLLILGLLPALPNRNPMTRDEECK